MPKLGGSFPTRHFKGAETSCFPNARPFLLTASFRAIYVADNQLHSPRARYVLECKHRMLRPVELGAVGTVGLGFLCVSIGAEAPDKVQRVCWNMLQSCRAERAHLQLDVVGVAAQVLSFRCHADQGRLARASSSRSRVWPVLVWPGALHGMHRAYLHERRTNGCPDRPTGLLVLATPDPSRPASPPPRSPLSPGEDVRERLASWIS
eukprot:361735-Chlamydomonas_euryale.AAC.3